MKIHFQEVKSSAQILAVEKLAHEIWTLHYTPILEAGQVPYMLQKFQSARAIKSQIDEGLQYFLILNPDSVSNASRVEKRFGYLAFKIEDESCFLSKIYLRASERGNGFGKAALDFVVAEARKSNAKNINLTVNKFNKIALDAYLKCGFLNVGPVQFDIGNGYIMDDFKLEKKI